MEQDKKSNFVSNITKEEIQIYERELKEISGYASCNKDKMEELNEIYKDKGFWGLMWDSKVSEEDKGFFYFFTVKRCDKDAVSKEIKEFEKKFDEMNKIMKAAEKEESVMKIRELKRFISKMTSEASSKKRCTGSSTVHRICSDIVRREDDLVRSLERIEVFLSRKDSEKREKQLAEARNLLTEKEKQIDVLVNENKDLAERWDATIKRNEELNNSFEQEKNEFESRNSKLEEALRASLDEGEKLRKECRELKDLLLQYIRMQQNSGNN